MKRSFLSLAFLLSLFLNCFSQGENPLHRSPYGDIVNMRIGFEFPMKKKPAKSKGN